jgi:hypothetical protein
MSEGPVPGVRTPAGEQAAITEERIREELNRVLASHEFRSSKRSQEFLRYVVEHTLTGHGDMLKERTIGIEVFGRPTSYDPSDDATVRVKAGEVRKRLGLYYADQGARDPVRIELPSGTYVPEFHGAPVPAIVPFPAPPNAAPHYSDQPSPQPFPQPFPQPRQYSTRQGAVILALLLAAMALTWYLTRPATTILDQFWSPVLEGKPPVLVCAAFVPVWNFDRDSNVSGPPKPDDYVPLTDQFVGGGDLLATSRLTAMLTRMKHPYRVKVGNDVSFADLRNGPAILVGYSYTRWRDISAQMRYFIDGARRPVGITDNGKPTEWVLPDLPRDRRTAEDYAIVSRLFHPDTHAMLVEIAGILQYGTEAAGDLVTNSDLMAEALHDAPPGWQKKNLQLVLHVKVISGAPTSPKVLKTYFW